MTPETLAGRESAVLVGFLLACCLIFGAIAWMALNYIESDVDRFVHWIDKGGDL